MKHGCMRDRQAVTFCKTIYLFGLSTGLKAPPGKGERCTIIHIGSISGVLEGLLIFKSNRSDNYPKDMNLVCFEKCFESILVQLQKNAVIVMDVAAFHLRRV
ncbi:hypothetical protein CEXT_622801 [Caerostris extrusa]|uniref:Uncharacterized protein n=1 Tax=Caerostris extrusa TaxID=172846 RepID=A0AAV4URF8_CAEEX|nr:hypothetical protein CEXT_622801 [Caerostris extrusa]